LALILAVAGLLAGSGRLAAQTVASGSASDVALAGVSAAAWNAPPTALPPILTPPASGASELVSIQEPPGMVPVLFGIFGGIAGLFLGDVWADRECDSDCGAGRIAMLFLAGGLGAMAGWAIGGGEIPQPPPERWP
jgi:hypothetical protein